MRHILQLVENISKISQFIQTAQINKIDQCVKLHISPEMKKDLSEWLALVLQKNNAPPQQGDLKSPTNLITKAWQAYFKHEYLHAYALFKQAYT